MRTSYLVRLNMCVLPLEILYSIKLSLYISIGNSWNDDTSLTNGSLKKIGRLHGLTWLYFPRSFFALRLRHPGFPELLHQAPWCVSSKATAEISHLGTDHRSSRWLKHKSFFDIVYIDDDDYYYYHHHHYHYYWVCNCVWSVSNDMQYAHSIESFNP